MKPLPIIPSHNYSLYLLFMDCFLIVTTFLSVEVVICDFSLQVIGELM